MMVLATLSPAPAKRSTLSIMRTVSYGGESFITSDEVAEALLEFTAAAALSEFAAVVHLPSLNGEGATVTADLVIGPSSELFVLPVESAFDEPDSADAVAELRRRTSELVSTRHVTTAEPAELVIDESEDWETLS